MFPFGLHSTSVTVLLAGSSLIPRWDVAPVYGSRSTRSVFFPACARQQAMFTADVVLPTPPLRDNIATILVSDIMVLFLIADGKNHLHLPARPFYGRARVPARTAGKNGGRDQLFSTQYRPRSSSILLSLANFFRS